jgi:hypothetical protein
MKATFKRISAALVGVAFTASVFAGDVFYNLDSDPAAIPGFIFTGNNALVNWISAGGNPATGGYVAITDAINSQTLGIVFPSADLFTNVDNSVIDIPIKAFRVECDLRIGNAVGCDGRPADGFSISLARVNDPVLYWATNATPSFQGYAGGDGCAQANQAASNPAGCNSGTAENGTKTGLAIAFDAWTGNELPNTAANANCVDDNDVEGIAIRVDDRTLLQVPMAVRNGLCDDTNSVQTGPYDPANPGSAAGLCWARLTAELDTNNQVTVTYKGRVMLDHYQLTNFPTPLNARLILAGRTGGCNQNTHIDNIRVTTVAAVQATLAGIVGAPNGFTFTLNDFGPSSITNVTQVLLDSVDVTAQTIISKAGGVTSGVYTQAVRFAPTSVHQVRIVVQDTVPQTLTFNTSFTTPNWILLPTNLALPLASMDTTKPGFLVNSYQTAAVTPQPNQLNWTEEQILGYWGPNAADLSASIGGLFNLETAVDYANAVGSTGRFPVDKPFTDFGQLGNPDNNTVECWGYVYFPTSGIYLMRFGSDDGFQISTGPHPRDRMGTVIMSFNGGRGIAVNQDVRPVIIEQPGAYPMRLLFQNGGGGVAFEWYFEFDPNTYVLVNDTSTPGAILAYRDILPGASVGPYVKSAVPVRGAVMVPGSSPIIVELGDGTGTRTVNQGSIQMSVDGVAQTLVISTPSAGTTRIVRSSGTPYPGTHTITLTYADNAANNYTNTWSFTVMNTLNSTAIPASYGVPLSAVDFANSPGFRVYSYQTDPASVPPGVNSPNTIGWLETQLQGLQGPNVATLTSPAPNDYFLWQNSIDFDDGDGEGYFRTGPNQNMDVFGFQAVGGGANRNNNTLLIGAWLVFSNAGNYIMRVTSDDAFLLSSGEGNPFNANGLKLSWFDGGRGSAGYNGGDFCQVTIPAPGAYPFRLLFGNGGGGFGVEWSFWKQLADGTYRQILINDLVDPDTIRAYHTTSQDAPLVKSVNPPLGFNGIGNGTPGYPFINLRRTTPLTLDLQNSTTTVNTNTIVLTLGGTVVPVSITQYTNGIVTDLFTRITASGDWPSGVRGKLVLTYQDNLGRPHTQSWDVITEVYGTLATGGSPLGSGDPAKRGFLLNMYQVHRLGGVNIPTRIHVAEQVLAGLWTNNVIPLGPGPGGAYVFAGAGENGTNGLVNFNQDAPGNAGRFNAGNGRTDRAFPGIPNNNLPVGQTDSFVGEVLTWVEFPTNGTYRMTVASDDGFRLSRGHARPTDKGQLIINSPAPVAGQIEAVLSGPASPQVMSRITGDLVVALGVSDGSGVSSGSTDPRQGCGVTNGAALAGKVALIYRGSCGFYEKVIRAQQAGAIAVVMVNDRPVATPGDGWFPIEMGLIGNNQNPPSIPAIMIDRADGDALEATITGGTPVNVTLTPDSLGHNVPPPDSVLGQADVGKGDSDVDFTVVVTQPGVYPLRLTWFEGGGGANLELYSWPDQVTRVLVNDDASAVPALKAYYEVTGQNPSLSISQQGGVVRVTYTGTLLSAPSLNGPWAPVVGSTSPYTVDTSGPGPRYFRSVN